MKGEGMRDEIFDAALQIGVGTIYSKGAFNIEQLNEQCEKCCNYFGLDTPQLMNKSYSVLLEPK